MGRLVFVDGYNVIHRDQRLAVLARTSLEAARNTLIQQLNADPKLRQDEITVVFDGADLPGVSRSYVARGRIRVRFSRAGQTADDLIRALIQAAGTPNVVVISNDRDVRAHASFAGGSALSIRADPRRPTAPPRANSAPSHPAHDFDPDAEEDDDPLPTFGRKKGNPNRAPRRRAARERDTYWQ